MSRAPLISSAISFLRDPTTASSPLAKRIQFLEAKGLTPQEIEQAFTASNSYGPSLSNSSNNYGQGGMVGGGGGGYPMRREFERDWRDWFIMGVVGGAVGFVAVKLAQKFLLPSLQPPSQTDLEASQLALSAKYDEATLLLLSLQSSTDALAKSLESQKEEVERDLVEVRKAVEEMREGERRREEWSKGVGEKVEGVVKGLPSMLEKQSQTQIQSLTDLQTELKSLKSLLVARRPLSSSSPSSTSPSATTITTTSSAPLPLPSSTSTNTEIPVVASGSGLGSGLGGGRTSNFGSRSPSIPAWQMQSNSRSLNSTTTTSTSIPTTSNSVSIPAVSVGGGGGGGGEDTGASGVLINKEDVANVTDVTNVSSTSVAGEGETEVIASGSA